MKFFRCAFCVLFIAVCHVRAQQDVDEKVDDFTPTLDDDMILYTQKFAFKLGIRSISGMKASFNGNGVLNSSLDIGDVTGTRARVYHDGSVLLDTRTVADPAGRSVPITPDGKTNTWAFADDSQAAINGLIAMHTYSAAITDMGREKNPAGSFGVELSGEREMGKIFNTRLKWGVIAGMSINGISSSANALVPATITTVTDYYSLFGQTAPTAPYSAPQTSGTVDTSVLLGNQPLGRTTSTSSTTTDVRNSSRLRGAFLTFRAGPTLFVPITEHFSGTFSAGFALVYSGTTYEMTQSFQPETGSEIVQTIRDGASDLLPGFYVDANLQYNVTDTAGLYLGAVYQNSGSFTQTISDDTGESKYSTRVDLSKLQGIRAGVSFKF